MFITHADAAISNEIEILEQFKTEVDALAEQEAEDMGKAYGTCDPNDTDLVEVGVPGASITMTTKEMQKWDYRRG